MTEIENKTHKLTQELPNKDTKKDKTKKLQQALLDNIKRRKANTKPNQ